jgi:hypothetical protein
MMWRALFARPHEEASSSVEWHPMTWRAISAGPWLPDFLHTLYWPRSPSELPLGPVGADRRAWHSLLATSSSALNPRFSTYMAIYEVAGIL